MSQSSWASVSYIDENGDEQTCDNYMTVTGNDKEWSDGWYIVNSNVFISTQATVKGTVNLILCDGFTLTVGHIQLTGDNSLTIYGQTKGTGKLTNSSPTTTNYSCIGGGSGGAGGMITINGGIVTAYGGDNAAAIGGGFNGIGGTITINGGTVTANGGDNAAGIGSGNRGEGGTITINGGTVTATGSDNAAGIGNGYQGGGGTITLGWTTETDSIYATSYNCTVTLTSGFLIDGVDPETAAIPGSFDGKKIVASKRVHAVSAGTGITAVPWEVEGKTVTFSYTETIPTGYKAVYSLNGSEFEGNSFTMPSGNAEIKAEVVPVIYTITYNLNGGTADNPTSYTVEAADFKLSNPTRTGYTFTGWTLSGDENIVDSDDLTVPASSIGDRTYIAGWNIITYTITYSLNGGTADNPTSYTVETDTFTLTPPKRKGFTFEGWTGTNLTEATASVTITKGSTGDCEYSAAWMLGGYTPEAEETPEFVYHQLILSGQLNMMFYVYIPDELSPEDCTMDFDISGDTSQNEQGQKYAETITEDGYTLYGYQCYFSSVQMADEIHATLHYGDSETLTHSYTVKTYLDLYADNENISDDTRELARSIKDYGSYVQPVLAENNGWVIGVKHAKMDAAHDFNDTDFNNVITDTADDAISYTIPEGSGISAVNYTLLLDAETTIEVYLTPADSYTGNVVVYVDGGSSNMAALEDGRYVVSISDIPAHRLAKKHTLKVVTGNVSFDVKVSALSYVHDGIRKGDDSMKRAVTSLYRYWDANMTYRHNRPDEYQD